MPIGLTMSGKTHPFAQPQAPLHRFDRFDLAYFRHTGKWFTVYRALTVAACFSEIERNEVFWPTT